MPKVEAVDYLNQKIDIIIDRPLGSKHPKYNFIYLLNYGYVPETISGDDEELDAYLLGVFEPVKNYTGKVIAVIKRINDQIRALTEFQERFFKSKIIRGIDHD